MTLNLRIPNPCSQRWDDMPAAGDGRRWCTRCERRITDFRGMSDGEIERVHALSDVPVCGVYDEAQLRPSVRQACPPRSKLVALALGTTLLSGTASAQSAAADRHPSIVQPADASPRPRDAEAPAEAPSPAGADTLIIRGTVRDADGRTIAGAIVRLGGTVIGTRTDARGGYELRVGERAALPSTLRLYFTQLGWSFHTVEVSSADPEPRVDVTLTPSAITLDRIVVGVVVRESFLTRLLKSIF